MDYVIEFGCISLVPRPLSETESEVEKSVLGLLYGRLHDTDFFDLQFKGPTEGLGTRLPIEGTGIVSPMHSQICSVR